MDKFIVSLQNMGADLKTLEMSLDSSIETLLKCDNRLRSFLLLKMLVCKAESALSHIKAEIPDIEKRLMTETDEICKQAEDVIKGLKTHSEWCKDIVDAIGELCKGMGLEDRQVELHRQIDEMENGLKSLIEKRNNLPLDQLDEEI